MLKRRDEFPKVKEVLVVDDKILKAEVYGGMLIEAWIDELFKFVWLFNMK